MFERFDADARRVVMRAAEDEAQAFGSSTIEAEHLLLALAGDEHSFAGRLLADSGLDQDGVRLALDRESERSLASVGVKTSEFHLPSRPSPPRRKPKFGTSAKLALERTARHAAARSARHITAADLLVGILRADLGTVPRMLAVAEIDRVALLTQAQRLVRTA